MDKKYKMLALLIPLFVFFNASSANATGEVTNSAEFNLDFTFGTTLTASLSSTDLHIDGLVPGAASDSNTIVLTASSNNATGYVISASTGDSNNNSSDLVQTGIVSKFSSIATDAELSTLNTDDTWGYSFKPDVTAGSDDTLTPGSWSKYNGLTTTSAPIFSVDSAAITDMSFKIAAKASDSMTPGEYTNVINFYVVTNAVPISFEDAFAAVAASDDSIVKLNGFYKMQDMSSSICSAVATPVASDDSDTQTTKLIDSRDNTVYAVAKLRDGRCWLLDNLALDLTDSTVQANLSASNTNATSTAIGYLLGTTSRDPNTTPNGNYATAGVTNFSSVNSYSAPMIYSALKDNTTASSDPIPAASDWKYGVLYNYCAASAGSYCYGNGGNSGTSLNRPDTLVDAEYDICPTGWRMPTSTASGEYNTLYNLYPDTDNATQYVRFRTALRAPLSGYYYSGTPAHQGVYGDIWSSTNIDNNSQMNYLVVRNSSINPSGSYARFNAFSVRCIAK